MVNFILATHIVSFFLKEDMQPSVNVLRILSLAIFVICLNIPFYLSLLAYNQKRSYLKVYSIGTVLNILFCVLLIRIGNEKGAAWAMVLTEFTILVGLAWEFYSKIVKANSRKPIQTIPQTNG